MKKVLILGAGMVVKPIVNYLLDNNYAVTVATRTKSKADAMIAGNPNGTSMAWTVDDEATLDNLVAEHDLSVSLLPYAYHAMVARLCIKHKKNMVTTSYVQPEMKALDEDGSTSLLLENDDYETADLVVSLIGTDGKGLAYSKTKVGIDS